MKLLIYLSAVMIAAVITSSCNDNKATGNETAKPEGTTIAVKKAGEGERTVVVVEKVPETIVTSFSAKVEKPEEVKWAVYKPVEADGWSMDRDYYLVSYRYNYVPYDAWITTDGEIIKTEPIIFLANSGILPTAVVKSILENYPGFEIVNLKKENDKDMDMFEVELKKGEEKAKVKFLPDGVIFKSKIK